MNKNLLLGSVFVGLLAASSAFADHTCGNVNVEDTEALHCSPGQLCPDYTLTGLEGRGTLLYIAPAVKDGLRNQLGKIDLDLKRSGIVHACADGAWLGRHRFQVSNFDEQ